MDLEAQINEALVAELQRQAEVSEGRLKVEGPDEGRLTVQGTIDVEALSMALVGSVAGGP